MGLWYTTVTGVERHDQADGGAWLYAETVRQIHAMNPGTGVELLIPDFNGRPNLLAHDAVKLRLQQGISQGQIRADADIEASADVLIGAPLYRILSATTAPKKMAKHCNGLIDTLMKGLYTR